MMWEDEYLHLLRLRAAFEVSVRFVDRGVLAEDETLPASPVSESEFMEVIARVAARDVEVLVFKLQG